jgi:hypothetical protein
MLLASTLTRCCKSAAAEAVGMPHALYVDMTPSEYRTQLINPTFHQSRGLLPTQINWAAWEHVGSESTGFTSEDPLIQNPPRLYADRKLRSQICQLAIEVWPQYGPWQVSKAGNLWELRGQSPRPDQMPHLARADATLQGLYEKVRQSPRGQPNR